MNKICFHFDDDIFAMNQWLYLVHLYKLDAYVIGAPQDVELHRSVKRVESYEEFDSPLVLFSKEADVTLDKYEYKDDDAVFCFWHDDSTMPVEYEKYFSDRVRIKAIGDGDMYSHQAGAIATYDRFING